MRKFKDNLQIEKKPQGSFVKALADVNNKEYNILVYYGVGGIGKSALLKHLKTQLLNNNNDSVYSSVDFEKEENRTMHKTLRILSQEFYLDFKVNSIAFGIAYAVYLSKAFPDYATKKRNCLFWKN